MINLLIFRPSWTVMTRTSRSTEELIIPVLRLLVLKRKKLEKRVSIVVLGVLRLGTIGDMPSLEGWFNLSDVIMLCL
jgi:hypothetical protein